MITVRGFAEVIMNMNLSVIIIAKNEQSTIRNCLESVIWADEIIVLDSGSSDNTVEIAREYTKHVYETDWQGYGVQKQRALKYASKDWVLNLDADEVVTDKLQQEIQTAIQNRQMDGYKLPIRMVFYGKPLRFSSSPSRHVRLFKRALASYSNDLVHEKIQLPKGARIGQLKTPLMHHSFRDLNHALSKMNQYSSYSAHIRITENKNPSFLKAFMSASWMFLRCYILQGGFLDGKPGFLFALYNAEGSWYRGIKQVYQDKVSA